MAPPSRTADLRPLIELLKEMFAADELHRHLRLKYPGIAEQVNASAPQAAYVQDAVEALHRTGDLDREFFTWLSELRPKRAAEIGHVAVAHIESEAPASDIASAFVGVVAEGEWVLRYHDDLRALHDSTPWEERIGEDRPELLLWAVALGLERPGSVIATTTGDMHEWIIARRDGHTVVWRSRPHVYPRSLAALAALKRAVRSRGLGELVEEVVDLYALRGHLATFRAAYRRPVLERLGAHLEEKLTDLDGVFVEQDVQIEGHEERVPAFEALDRWLHSDQQQAWMVGEYGLGKSTLLVAWAHRCWTAAAAPLPLPVLVSLTDASPDLAPIALLCRALAVDDTPQACARLRLLMRYHALVPCFDGLDEVFTRMVRERFERFIGDLKFGIDGRARVMMSARDHFFPSDRDLEKLLPRAHRLKVLRLSGAQVDSLIERQAGKSARALHARLERTPDLRDLMTRPLLCGMVLQTLDTLDPTAQIGTADVYEAYLARWLRQAHAGAPENLSDDEKLVFAEQFAAELWRSGQPGLDLKQLRHSVLRNLADPLATNEALDSQSVFYEIQGSAFIVRVGDSYRFAHKSLFEYLLARHLVRRLPENPEEHLGTRPWTRETVEFVDQILARHGEDPFASPAVRALQRMLIATTTPSTGEDTRPNAVRLLLGLARVRADERQWVPPGANLCHLAFSREFIRDAHLAGVHLDHANLDECDLRSVNLTGATLVGTSICGACLDGAVLRGVRAAGASLVMTHASGVDLEDAALDAADLKNSVWHACRTTGIVLTGANLDGVLLPPFAYFTAPEARSVGARLIAPHTVKRGESPIVANGLKICWSSTGSDVLHGPTGLPVLRLSDAPTMAAALSRDGSLAAGIDDDARLSVWQMNPPRLLDTRRLTTIEAPQERNGDDWEQNCRDFLIAVTAEDVMSLRFVTASGGAIVIEPRGALIHVREEAGVDPPGELPRADEEDETAESESDQQTESPEITALSLDDTNILVTMNGERDSVVQVPQAQPGPAVTTRSQSEHEAELRGPRTGLQSTRVMYALSGHRSSRGTYTLHRPRDNEGPLEIRTSDKTWRSRAGRDDEPFWLGEIRAAWASDESAMAAIQMNQESIGSYFLGRTSRSLFLWAETMEGIAVREQEGATAVAISREDDAYAFALGFFDGRVVEHRAPLAEFPEGRVTRELPRPSCSQIEAIAYSPDGSRIAYVARGGRMCLLAMPDGHELRTVQIPWGSCLAWSRDGRRLVAAGGNELHCFTRDGEFYCKITLSGRGTRWETPAGFYYAEPDFVPSHVAVAPLTAAFPAIVRPAGALAKRLHRLDRVEAALRLDLSEDDITADLGELGWLPLSTSA